MRRKRRLFLVGADHTVPNPIDVAGHVPEGPLAEPTPGRASRRWVTSAIVIGLLTAIAIHLSRTHDELASIRRLSFPVLAGGCALQLISQLFLNGSLLMPLRQCVTPLGFWELYLVRTGGFFVSSVVPVAGGLAVRLAYLRGRGLTYLDFTWATLFSNVLALASAAVLAVAAAGLLWLKAGPLPPGLLGVTAAILVVGVATVFVFEYLPRLTRHGPLRRWQWLAGMSGVRSRPLLALRVFNWSLVRHTLNFVTFGLLYESLTRNPADFLAGGLVYALTSPIRMVNITPANLGVTEWFVALVGRMVAFDVATGLIVSLAFRGVALVAQMMGAAFGSAWLALRKPR
jgi:lysylphosphatidylglycerol synthase-like protein